MFSHMFFLFLSLLLVFLKKSLLTNFFAPFSAAWESNFLSHFSYPWHSKLVRRTCAPCFWHRMHGFLVARCLWEPGNRLTTGEFSLYHLLPKISAANVHWIEHDSYLSFSQKFSDLHFPAWPWPSQATQYSLDMESPKGYPNSWIGWLLPVLWQLPRALLKAIVRAFLTTKSFTAGSSMYPCHMACISKSVMKDVISLSNYVPNSTEAPWMRRAIVGGWSLSIPFSWLWGSGA
jgi:hypothetical protein